MRLGHGEYTAGQRSYSAWSPSPVVAHARHLFMMELAHPKVGEWPTAQLIALRAWKHSLPGRIRAVPMSGDAKRAVLEIVTAWAAELHVGHEWFVHLVIADGGGGPNMAGVQAELDEIGREENMVASSEPGHIRSIHEVSAATVDIRLHFDLTALTIADVRRATQEAVDQQISRTETAIRIDPTADLDRTAKLVEGTVRSTVRRLRWLALHHCFKLPYSKIGDATYDEVKKAVRQARREVGLPRD